MMRTQTPSLFLTRVFDAKLRKYIWCPRTFSVVVVEHHAIIQLLILVHQTRASTRSLINIKKNFIFFCMTGSFYRLTRLSQPDITNRKKCRFRKYYSLIHRGLDRSRNY